MEITSPLWPNLPLSLALNWEGFGTLLEEGWASLEFQGAMEEGGRRRTLFKEGKVILIASSLPLYSSHPSKQAWRTNKVIVLHIPS